MRILQIGKYYPPIRGGMERVVSELSENLVIAGHEVRVLCAGAREAKLERNGVSVFPLLTLGTLASQPLVFGLKRAIRQFKPDVIHAHLPNPLILPTLVRTNLPFVLTLHARPAGWKGSLDHALTLWFAKQAKAVIFSSDEEKKHWPSLSVPVHTIPFGFRFETLPESPEIEREHDLIACVGRLVGYKGYQVLMQALSQTPTARVCIAGDGPMRKQLEFMARPFGARVQFLGEISDLELAQLYRRAAIFVQPSVSTSEAFGIATLEAMHFGLAVITTDLASGVRSLNQHLKSGLVVQAGDPARLAAAINVLLKDQELANRLGNAAKTRAKFFDPSRMTNAHLDLYQSLVGGRDENKTSSIYDRLAEPLH